MENNTLDISTNDEEKLADVTNKINTDQIPHKRTIQKPNRFCASPSSSSSSSPETEEEHETIQTKSIVLSNIRTLKKEAAENLTAVNSCMLH